MKIQRWFFSSTYKVLGGSSDGPGDFTTQMSSIRSKVRMWNDASIRRSSSSFGLTVELVQIQLPSKGFIFALIKKHGHDFFDKCIMIKYFKRSALIHPRNNVGILVLSRAVQHQMELKRKAQVVAWGGGGAWFSGAGSIRPGSWTTCCFFRNHCVLFLTYHQVSWCCCGCGQEERLVFFFFFSAAASIIAARTIKVVEERNESIELYHFFVASAIEDDAVVVVLLVLFLLVVVGWWWWRAGRRVVLLAFNDHGRWWWWWGGCGYNRKEAIVHRKESMMVFLKSSLTRGRLLLLLLLRRIEEVVESIDFVIGQNHITSTSSTLILLLPQHSWRRLLLLAARPAGETRWNNSQRGGRRGPRRGVFCLWNDNLGGFMSNDWLAKIGLTSDKTLKNKWSWFFASVRFCCSFGPSLLLLYQQEEP